MFGVIVGAFGVAIAVAAFVAIALDRQSRQSAWQRIAVSRRLNAEQKRELEELLVTLHVREIKLEDRERHLDIREQELFQRETALIKRTQQ